MLDLCKTRLDKTLGAPLFIIKVLTQDTKYRNHPYPEELYNLCKTDLE